MTKWEILELIFLVSFLSQPNTCSCGEKINCFFWGFESGESLPIVLKLVLRILLRSVEKMPIAGELSTPCKPRASRVSSSEIKNKHQEELLSELRNYKVLVKDLKQQLKGVRKEITEVKLQTEETLQDTDSHELKSKVESLQEALETRNALVQRQNQEVAKLQDELDFAKHETNLLTQKETKYRNIEEKLKKFQEQEKQLSELKSNFEEVLKDKKELLNQLNHYKRQASVVPGLESEIQNLNTKLAETNYQVKQLENQISTKDQQLLKCEQELTLKKNLEYEIEFLKAKIDSPFSSAKTSLTDNQSLMIEEYEARIKLLEQENYSMKNQTRESYDELLGKVDSLKLIKENTLLQYVQLQADYNQFYCEKEQEIETLNEEIKQLQEKVTYLQTNLNCEKAVNLELHEKLSKFNELQVQIETLTENKKVLSEILEKRTNLIGDLNQQIQKLMQDSNSKANQVDELRSEVSQLRSYTQESHLSDHNQKNLLETAFKNTKELTNINKDLETQLRAKENQVLVLQSENQKYLKQLETKTKEIFEMSQTSKYTEGSHEFQLETLKSQLKQEEMLKLQGKFHLETRKRQELQQRLYAIESRFSQIN